MGVHLSWLYKTIQLDIFIQNQSLSNNAIERTICQNLDVVK